MITDDVLDTAMSELPYTRLLIDRAEHRLNYAKNDIDASDAAREIEEAIANLYDCLLLIDPKTDLLERIRIEVAERGRS